MAYELPKLPYAFNALEPHIDAKTMEIHHGKHHQAYITNANNFLKDHPALDALPVNALIADLSKVPEAIRGGPEMAPVISSRKPSPCSRRKRSVTNCWCACGWAWRSEQPREECD